VAQRPRPTSPQITWREVKSARRRPPLLRGRPGSPWTTQADDGGRQTPPETHVHRLSFLQCFSELFPTRHDHLPASFTVASHPTRGLPVDGRSRHVFPNVSVYDTTTFGRVSRSPAIRHEVFRSTAALAMLFRTFLHFTGHNDLSNGSVCGTIRQRSGEHSGHRPSDARSSGRRPHSPSSSEHVGIRHDYLRARFTVASHPTRGLPVDGRSRQDFPNVSIPDTTTFRRGSRSPAIRHEVFRSTAVLAKLFRTF
jgi:hypothetical protein